MKTVITYKMMRKCLILVFMVMGLIFVASSNKFTPSVAASQCCENCIGDGDQNLIEGYCNAIGVACAFNPLCPTSPIGAYNDCINEAQGCYLHCTYCFSNEPGAECNSNSDCNINEFCGADNHCHTW